MGLIILDNFLDAAKFFLILYFGFGEQFREKKKRNFGLVVLIEAGYSLIRFYYPNLSAEVTVSIQFLCMCFSFCILFKIAKLKLILEIFWSMILIGISDAMIVEIMQIICVQYNYEYHTMYVSLIADTCTLVFFIICYCTFFQKKYSFLKNVKPARLINLLVIIICYLFILAVLWEAYILDVIKINKNWNIYLIYILLVLAAYYHCIVLLKYAIVNKELREMNTENNKLLFLQEKQYLYMNQVELETKKFRHDIKNHFAILSSLSKDKKWGEVEEYLEQISEKISSISPNQYVNHSIADAIIQQFAAQCKGSNINFRVKGFIPSNCNISYYDMTTILTNLLQNAYEATIPQEKKDLTLTFRFDEEYVYIIEENVFDGTLLEENGKIKTKKEDKSMHGFGLENINEAVKKYNGESFYDIDVNTLGDKVFRVNIVIPIHKPEAE